MRGGVRLRMPGLRGRYPRSMGLATAGESTVVPRTPRRRWARVVGIVLVVGVVLAGLDVVARQVEASALLAAAERSDRARGALQQTLTNLDSTWLNASENARSEGRSLDPEDYAWLWPVYSDHVPQYVPGLSDAQDDLLALRMLPWHTELVEARDLYAAHVGTWTAFANAVGADGSEAVKWRARLDQSQERAFDALRDAMRWTLNPRDMERVAVLEP